MATQQQQQMPPPYRGDQIAAAYKAIYGSLPIGMANPKTGELNPSIEYVYPGTVLKTPSGQDIDSSQLMYMYKQSQAGGGQGGQAGAGAGGQMPMGAGGQPMPMGVGGQMMSQGQGTSYLGAPNQLTSGATNMADITQQGGSGVLFNTKGQPISPAQTAEIMRLYQAYEQGDMKAGQAAVQWGQALGIDLDGAVNNMRQGTGPNAPAANPASNVPPETNALAQMGQIDPASEALRSAVAGSYLTPLQQAAQNLNKQPGAADYQNYLDLFKKVDPEEYAQRQGMATSMDSYLRQAQAEAALGSQLDPVTARQVEQQARAGQAARGNIYGTPQMVSEAMATGQAGEARKQQRQAALSQALGQQQGYLGAGLGLGDTAMQLYQQGLSNQAQRMQQLQGLQGGALTYLSSGQTPYQAGASYMDRANANAANAAQGGPVYQPASLGQGNLGTAQQAPQYGLDIGAQSQNYFNSLNNAYGGGAAGSQKNRGVSAATGAATGAISGAAAGSVVPVYGTAIGAVVGGVAGGLGGYYS
jgi:hypothetical protein